MLHVKTELKHMNGVGKYKLRSVVLANSVLQNLDPTNRLILILQVLAGCIFDVLGVAVFLRSSLTLGLRFGGILADPFLSLLFAPHFLAWARPNFGWSQILGLARSRNITGAWL